VFVTATHTVNPRVVEITWSLGGTEMMAKDFIDELDDYDKTAPGADPYYTFASVAYNGASQVPTLILGNVVNGDVVEGNFGVLRYGQGYNFSLSEGAGVVAGLHSYSVNSLADDNYVLPEQGTGYRTVYYKITPKELTVEWDTSVEYVYAGTAAQDIQIATVDTALSATKSL
jgi:hypothetical protein